MAKLEETKSIMTNELGEYKSDHIYNHRTVRIDKTQKQLKYIEDEEIYIYEGNIFTQSLLFIDLDKPLFIQGCLQGNIITSQSTLNVRGWTHCVSLRVTDGDLNIHDIDANTSIEVNGKLDATGNINIPTGIIEAKDIFISGAIKCHTIFNNK